MEGRHLTIMQISRIKLNLTSNEKLTFPTFFGSTIRGAFGNILKETTCVQKNHNCPSCMLRNNCPYTYLFESPWYFSNKDKPRAGVPQPFVFDTSNNSNMGRDINLELLLYGDSISYLPYFIYCFDKLGEYGLGRNRINYSLESVTDLFNKNLLLADNENKIIVKRPTTKNWSDYAKEAEELGAVSYCHIHFVTPLRVKQEGKLQNLVDFDLLFRAIMRRWVQLCKYYALEYSNENISQLIEKAKNIPSGTLNVKWQERERYSRRQEQRMMMGGITGTMECEGELEPFLPWLLLGQDLHIGKNTSFGLGKYIIECK